MAKKGKGAVLRLHNGTSLVAIGGLLSASPPKPTRDTIDTTDHDSTGDYREFISSLIDAGELSATIHYASGSPGDTVLLDAFAAGDLRAFELEINGDDGLGGDQRRVISGSAIVTEYGPDDQPIDDKQVGSLSLKVSGPLVFSNATP